jgi:hypothetical protein
VPPTAAAHAALARFRQESLTQSPRPPVLPEGNTSVTTTVPTATTGAMSLPHSHSSLAPPCVTEEGVKELPEDGRGGTRPSQNRQITECFHKWRARFHPRRNSLTASECLAREVRLLWTIRTGCCYGSPV